MKKKIHWQPEISYLIIYWSTALCIVFYGLILALENTSPYLTSNLVMALGIIVIFLGFRRSMIVEKNQLIIYYARFWKVSVLNFNSIQKIEVQKNTLTVTTTFSTIQFRMSKKAVQKFLTELNHVGQNQLIIEK